jgi:hypothetical protein
MKEHCWLIPPPFSEHTFLTFARGKLKGGRTARMHHLPAKLKFKTHRFCTYHDMKRIDSLFSRNLPLKSTDDWDIRILKNNIKDLGFLLYN